MRKLSPTLLAVGALGLAAVPGARRLLPNSRRSADRALTRITSTRGRAAATSTPCSSSPAPADFTADRTRAGRPGGRSTVRARSSIRTARREATSPRLTAIHLCVHSGGCHRTTNITNTGQGSVCGIG